ncbi:MAG: galactose-1-phosphate uridylyltransferase [Nitrospinae bacterium]|nr:galactose-1-phosphate uridylyltransferase [Nitrospinota bacterium]
MSELRKDLITREWVIIATERSKRPEDFHPHGEHNEARPEYVQSCPFCRGNEHMVPLPLTSFPPTEMRSTAQEWLVQVVPNKFAALSWQQPLDRRDIGIYDWMRGTGHHEVIIETPLHNQSLADLSVEHIHWVIQAYIDRYRALREDSRLKYIMIFKNYGRIAGASLDHSHSQLIAAPFIPQQVWHQVKGSEQYFEYRDCCPMCDILTVEQQTGERLILNAGTFQAVAPYMSRYPYEVWLIPQRHVASFASMTPEEVLALSGSLQEVLRRLAILLHDPPYNLMIHTSFCQDEDNRLFHWHIQIVPRLSVAAGFELGTGVFINMVSPEDAARHLREGPLAGGTSSSSG